MEALGGRRGRGWWTKNSGCGYLLLQGSGCRVLLNATILIAMRFVVARCTLWGPLLSQHAFWTGHDLDSMEEHQFLKRAAGRPQL